MWCDGAGEGSPHRSACNKRIKELPSRWHLSAECGVEQGIVAMATEREWAERVAAGDVAAFTELV